MVLKLHPVSVCGMVGLQYDCFQISKSSPCFSVIILWSCARQEPLNCFLYFSNGHLDCILPWGKKGLGSPTLQSCWYHSFDVYIQTCNNMHLGNNLTFLLTFKCLVLTDTAKLCIFMGTRWYVDTCVHCVIFKYLLFLYDRNIQNPFFLRI